MKKIYTLIIFTVLSRNLYSNPVKVSVRDPFWPIGYAPPPPIVEKPVEEPKIVQVKKEKPKPPPPPKPVTTDEWKMARKLLNITGYALASKTVKKEKIKTSLVIINRSYYKSGAIVKITSENVEYIWRVGEIRNNSVNLKQESAKRLKNTPGKGAVKTPSPEIMK